MEPPCPTTFLKRPPNQNPDWLLISQITISGTSRKRPPKPDIKGGSLTGGSTVIKNKIKRIKKRKTKQDGHGTQGSILSPTPKILKNTDLVII